MLALENLYKRYVTSDGTAGGIFGIDFEVAEGELFTLLGPSGCGKTTTLRSIAGLELPDRGVIRLADRSLFNAEAGVFTPMYDRDIGMVFQSYAIWPHLNVFENAAYPLRVSRRKRMAESEIRKRVSDVLDVVGLARYIDRPSTQLSGGQQQRLALARALVREPKLMLLDEPLSNLDAQLREQMRDELKRLQKEWGVTSIYVTHDQAEALALSDRIAVMNEGRVVQLGTPKQIYHEPNSEFVANFIGKSNMLSATVQSAPASCDIGSVMIPIGPLRCRFRHPAAVDDSVSIVVRPESIALSASSPKKIDGANRFEGTVLGETFLGELLEYKVVMGHDLSLTVRCAPVAGVDVGSTVTICLPETATVALPSAASRA
ncbi:ABC transporter ATP-binding protein [Rhizobium sp. P32RR-XVIII]|uniref:ABC transporter ATP-binding protein n=1 Tax=Rhizobium sp. P32RR-XVIII TaxID=2726738 RepID=UPI0014563D51|nr:ABC transporter ATP-binding protein [Rhizobium sp. P32RR-XVIII]NLS03797.1 ABC transporter ATP-binding protein [Rhizobium sp. P32RR-XVIII]